VATGSFIYPILPKILLCLLTLTQLRSRDINQNRLKRGTTPRYTRVYSAGMAARFDQQPNTGVESSQEAIEECENST
jgi:hypothetical protein